jgi:hypothetical protein
MMLELSSDQTCDPLGKSHFDVSSQPHDAKPRRCESTNDVAFSPPGCAGIGNSWHWTALIADVAFNDYLEVSMSKESKFNYDPIIVFSHHWEDTSAFEGA